jgi:hypothetical protein
MTISAIVILKIVCVKIGGNENNGKVKGQQKANKNIDNK